MQYYEKENRIIVLFCRRMTKNLQNEKPVCYQIWLADDSPVYRTLISQELRFTTGIKIRCFNDGDSLVKAYSEDPMLIILDFHFDFDDHEKNGSNTLLQLREKGCKSPVILVTGVSEEHFVAEKRKEDFLEVFDKFEEDMIGRLTTIIKSLPLYPEALKA